MTKLNFGDKVIIIWTKKNGFIELEGIFEKYQKEDPIFLTSKGVVLGTESFWLLKSQIKSPDDIKHYQNLLLPLQSRILEISRELNIPPVVKIRHKEIDKLNQQNIKSRYHLESFIRKYGFDPTDESWVEKYLAENDIEKKWFEYVRLTKPHFLNQEMIDIFNHKYKENINLDMGKELIKKRVRYIFGAFKIRYQGVNNVDEWTKAAKEFEKDFSDRDKRMEGWSKSRNGKFPYVTVVKPIEFWSGTMLMQCIEKIPDVFTNPDCNFIKPGVSLEVNSYDPETHWIHLDFTPDIRERLTGKKEREESNPYAIVLHPNDIEEFLDGTEQLQNLGE